MRKLFSIMTSIIIKPSTTMPPHIPPINKEELLRIHPELARFFEEDSYDSNAQ